MPNDPHSKRRNVAAPSADAATSIQQTGHEQQFLSRARLIVANIARSGKTIYDPIPVGDPDFWLTTPELQILLNAELKGLVVDQPIRTRSKVVKTRICEILGYPVPKSFKKTRPRIPAQDCGVSTQKANNFQPWNEELVATRRYIFVRAAENDLVDRVKVVTGERLAELDTTGTLTTKYQATYKRPATPLDLASSKDTPATSKLLSKNQNPQLSLHSPVDYPVSDTLLSIEKLLERLSPLVGQSFPNIGAHQERNRGGALHKLVCRQLGYKDFAEDGTCPDIKHQLLEVKLQTSPTIDLGLILPNSMDPIDLPRIQDVTLRHQDVRYLVVGADLKESSVTIRHLTLATGADFFKRFPQFQGKVINAKLQIHLPKDFFEI